MSFRDQGIAAVEGFHGEGFLVRPLLPSDVVMDYEAVMSSREFLFHWEQEPPWPAADISIQQMATIGIVGLTRCFDDGRDKDLYTSYVYT